jgi:3-oxoacyl-[acyl-carrier protein] reductase
MNLELREKVAGVTGGSVGIGLAFAEGLAAEGVQLVLAARQEHRVKIEANRIAEKFNVRAIGVAADAVTVPGTKALIRAAETEFGGADIRINNGGIERDRAGTENRKPKTEN